MARATAELFPMAHCSTLENTGMASCFTKHGFNHRILHSDTLSLMTKKGGGKLLFSVTVEIEV